MFGVGKALPGLRSVILACTYLEPQGIQDVRQPISRRHGADCSWYVLLRSSPEIGRLAIQLWRAICHHSQTLWPARRHPLIHPAGRTDSMSVCFSSSSR